MIVYYAHSLRKYNTEEEASEEQTIRRLFGTSIINPRTAVDQAAFDPMGLCFDLIRQADGVVFTEYLEYIGGGVHEEIVLAQRLGKPVWLLRDGVLHRNFWIEPVGLSWSVSYARISLEKPQAKPAIKRVPSKRILAWSLLAVTFGLGVAVFVPPVRNLWHIGGIATLHTLACYAVAKAHDGGAGSAILLYLLSSVGILYLASAIRVLP